MKTLTEKSPTAVISLVLSVALGLWLAAGSFAAVTGEHKKQLDEVKKDVGKVQGLITSKKYDEATKILEDAETKLKQIAKDAGIEEDNKLVAGVFKQIEQKREAIAKKRPGGGAAAGAGAAAVVFEKEVAPILAARCLNCHGERNPRANLRMDTFGGIVQGGANGPIVVPGKPRDSLLVLRLNATDDARMPKGGDPLTADEIKKITAWVAGGAKFTGDNSIPIGNLKAPEEVAKVDNTPVKIDKATGNETVSFTKDIAPWFVNLCLNCHSGQGPGATQTGLSVETFEKLMRGSKKGRVVLPGNTKDSLLWQRVGEQEPSKMPPGNQVLITRTNWNNLRTWIEEGAKFDGGDAKTPIRSLVPTDAEKRAKELASLSPDELAKRRKDRANELWTAAHPNEAPAVYENAGFIAIGNAAEPRLKQIADWATTDSEMLRKAFRIKEALIWPGKLIIFVFKDRFSYTEFGQSNEKVEIPAEAKGHSRVSANSVEAYLCLQDIGDSATEDSPGVRTQLLGLLAEGLLQRYPNRVPDWAARGTGLALAARNDPKNPYFRGLVVMAREALQAIDKPEELFANGTFSPGDLAPVGFTLVTHMLKKGDEPHFVQFLGLLTNGKSVADGLKDVYGADIPTLYQSYREYVESLPGVKPAPKKSKK